MHICFTFCLGSGQNIPCSFSAKMLSLLPKMTRLVWPETYIDSSLSQVWLHSVSVYECFFPKLRLYICMDAINLYLENRFQESLDGYLPEHSIHFQS